MLVKAKFTVKKRRMRGCSATAFGDFDREFGFDSHEWSCSLHTKGRDTRTSAPASRVLVKLKGPVRENDTESLRLLQADANGHGSCERTRRVGHVDRLELPDAQEREDLVTERRDVSVNVRLRANFSICRQFSDGSLEGRLIFLPRKT